MSITSTGFSDDERSGRSGERRGVLGAQWDGRDAFSVEEAGKILGLSRASSFAAANRGDIPTIRIGKRLIVPRRGLEKLLGADEVIPAGGQQALQVVEVPSAPLAPAPQRVEVAIQVLPPERRPRGRSKKPAPTASTAAPSSTPVIAAPPAPPEDAPAVLSGEAR
jgi:hypothetical protein